MNRRQLLAALPLAGLTTHAFAQTPAAGGAATGAARPPAPPLAEPSLPMKVLADGLQFPEGPVVMKDGSVIFVEIEKHAISRLTPAGKVEAVVDATMGPNGLAVGPDGAMYVANNGDRFSFNKVNGTNLPGAMPATHRPGLIQRLDLKTRKIETLFSTVDGKPLFAPDDLVFDRDGGMWVTELGGGGVPGAILYAAKGARELTVARPGLSGPNGVGLSPNGKLLHVSMGGALYSYDVTGPGKLETRSWPDAGRQAPLVLGSGADSLKVLASGRVAVCSLSRPGGIGVHDKDGTVRFFGFPDRMTCNIAFGGADMRDAWIMLSGRGEIAKVRWPEPGLRPAFSA